jgi:hypothetical protein
MSVCDSFLLHAPASKTLTTAFTYDMNTYLGYAYTGGFPVGSRTPTETAPLFIAFSIIFAVLVTLLEYDAYSTKDTSMKTLGKLVSKLRNMEVLPIIP